MLLAGLQKMTLLDYPQKVAATVFTCGCNFLCGFCHNPELIDIKTCNPEISEKYFFDFLKTRQNMLDGVCITGGEPTIQKDLVDFIRKIKDLGFLVKLDTNGSNPQMLKDLYDENLLDYVAMDIKTSFDKYPKAIGIDFNLNNIKKSIGLIKQSNVDYEFRTTVVPDLVDEDDIRKIGEEVGPGKKIALQQFRPQKTYLKELQNLKPYPDDILKKFETIAKKYFVKTEIRGL